MYPLDDHAQVVLPVLKVLQPAASAVDEFPTPNAMTAATAEIMPVMKAVSFLFLFISFPLSRSFEIYVGELTRGPVVAPGLTVVPNAWTGQF